MFTPPPPPQVDDPQTHQGRLLGLVRSYLLPQGFPDSVAPQYASYMGWRGVQYFFGGAMSVFTTKCLLTSLGVAGRHSVSRSSWSGVVLCWFAMRAVWGGLLLFCGCCESGRSAWKAVATRMAQQQRR